jgi:hypothetical protein
MASTALGGAVEQAGSQRGSRSKMLANRHARARRRTVDAEHAQRQVLQREIA